MKANKITLLSALVALSLQPFQSHATDSIQLNDLTKNDPFFYTSDQNIEADDPVHNLLGVGRPHTTHSKIPHLPVYYGYMSTNSTYRFLNVVEQVFTMIGEGKHGLWRIQENGTVREYLKKGAKGLPKGSDLFSAKNQEIINNNYSSYLPDESWSGYKYPDQKINENGNLNFIDLPITHSKYKNKYSKHDPIELPNFYCTMSGPDYNYAKQALDFSFNQLGANQVGPLGKRAGLDIKENYSKVIRLEQFPDGRTWVNVGQKNKDATYLNWQAVDASKTETEYYLVERAFFNKKYLFVTAVYDNKDNADFQYIRPQGEYFKSLKERNISPKTNVTQAPRFHLENGQLEAVKGLPVFGVHHPDRNVYGGGGACPLKGGDYGRYPDTTAGSAWPTNYEEITPICDGVLVDIKFFSNLDGSSWNNPNKYLANAGAGTKSVTYKMQGGEYGVFTDEYNTKLGMKNPDSQNVPSELTLTFPSVSEPVGYTPTNMGEPGKAMLPMEGTSCRPIPPSEYSDMSAK